MSGDRNGINIIGLAAEAKALGYDTPGKIIAGLEYIIKDQTAYVNRPSRQGRRFNSVVEERNKIIAMAIVLIESTTSS
ncbi:hypothetical protein KSF_095620 [Reticulibacter mediterranei]|uniref:Uncharacterized protein n=1 Tax=Reticulibacter mediterranei TaxID=2778369 RepID=A0A8J3IX59_9CHLR|nr:hypothetical protein [Reticulibacter mediterranei]GHO99514.1 hypothetical protein KSF_095620 [Reticulibacter mediterranei]